MVIQTQDDHTKGIFFAREILQETYVLTKMEMAFVGHKSLVSHD